MVVPTKPLLSTSWEHPWNVPEPFPPSPTICPPAPAVPPFPAFLGPPAPPSPELPAAPPAAGRSAVEARRATAAGAGRGAPRAGRIRTAVGGRAGAVSVAAPPGPRWLPPFRRSFLRSHRRRRDRNVRPRRGGDRNRTDPILRPFGTNRFHRFLRLQPTLARQRHREPDKRGCSSKRPPNRRISSLTDRLLHFPPLSRRAGNRRSTMHDQTTSAVARKHLRTKACKGPGAKKAHARRFSLDRCRCPSRRWAPGLTKCRRAHAASSIAGSSLST